MPATCAATDRGATRERIEPQRLGGDPAEHGAIDIARLPGDDGPAPLRARHAGTAFPVQPPASSATVVAGPLQKTADLFGVRGRVREAEDAPRAPHHHLLGAANSLEQDSGCILADQAILLGVRIKVGTSMRHRRAT